MNQCPNPDGGKQLVQANKDKPANPATLDNEADEGGVCFLQHRLCLLQDEFGGIPET